MGGGRRCFPQRGSCQNFGPFLGSLKIRCRITLRTQKKTYDFDGHAYRQAPTSLHQTSMLTRRLQEQQSTGMRRPWRCWPRPGLLREGFFP